VIATIMPITTKTTIAICVQIQVGDMFGQPTRTVAANGVDRLSDLYRWPIPMMMSPRQQRTALMVALALGLAIFLTAAASASSRHGARVSSSGPLGGVNVVGLGYNSSPHEADHSIAVAKALHARVVRVVMPWAVLEPREDLGVDGQALQFSDRLMADAEAAGIKVIMTVERTPCWASSAPSSILRKCRPTMESEANAYPPRSTAPYAKIVSFLARRYGKGLAALEVWSEPDQTNEDYFAGPEKVARYAALLRAAYPAIKQADPSVTVLGGSLTGSNGLFLKALYAAGIKGFYDGLSVHYYNLTLASVRSIHQVQLANGDNKPLWLDEYGWTSCWPRQHTQQQQGCVTPATQALNVTNTFRALARVPYVAAAVLYKIQDSRGEDFGLLSQRGQRKPAFAGLARALASPFGAISGVRVKLHRSGSHVVATGSAPVGDFMQLEVFQGPTLRFRSLFTLNRFNRFTVSLPSVLGTSGLRVRVFQYWMGSGHAAQRGI
jgi:Cellulase (glycosyl hydrolase family 5)